MSDRFIGRLFGRKKMSKEELEEYNRIKNQTLASLSDINYGKFTKGLELAEKTLGECDKLEQPIMVAEALYLKANALLGLGRYSKALISINEGENIIHNVQSLKKKEIESRIYIYKILRAMIYRRQGAIDLAMNDLQESILLMEKSKNRKVIAELYNDLGVIFAIKGEIQEANDHFQKSLSCYKELGMEVPSSLYNNLGLITRYIGDLDRSLDYFEEAIANDSEKNPYLTSVISLNKGLTHISQGELKLALKGFEGCFAHYEEFACKWELATSLNNIGTIYEQKGDLDQAFEVYTRSLAIFEDLGNTIEQAMCLNNIGNIYLIQGEIEKAISYYQKSLNYIKTSNSLDLSIILYNLCTSNLQQNNRKEAEEYLQELKLINENANNKVIDQLYRLTNAFFLKTSKRVIKQAEAQTMFQKIAEEDVLEHELSLNAQKNYNELLFEELAKSGNEDVLQEIKVNLNRLLQIAENQKLDSLLIETYIIQSKIAVLELDLALARSLLGKAQMLADETRFPSLAVIISNQFDEILNRTDKLEEIDADISLKERLKMTELETMVTQIVKKKAEITEIPEEKAVLFLILTKSGMSIFSRHFVPESVLADQLIAGFLTAINAFTEELFSESGSIEGIKHQEYTILMKPIRSFLCCYIFRGPSYYALQKMNQFSQNLLVSDPILDILYEGSSLGLDVSENPVVIDLLTRVFLSSHIKLEKGETQSIFQKLTIPLRHGIYLEMSSLYI